MIIQIIPRTLRTEKESLRTALCEKIVYTHSTSLVSDKLRLYVEVKT